MPSRAVAPKSCARVLKYLQGYQALSAWALTDPSAPDVPVATLEKVMDALAALHSPPVPAQDAAACANLLSAAQLIEV